MFQPDISKQYPNVPSSFVSMVDDVEWSAVTGECGSPFWLCVTEPTEKFGPYGIPQNGTWNGSPQAHIAEHARRAEFREYVRFLCALANDERVKDPNGYLDISIGECGFVISTFPFALPVRNMAQQSWNRDPAIRELNGRWRSMSDWTTIGDYEECLDWIAQHRHEQGHFADFRKKHHPYLIYCAGKQDMGRMHAMWTNNEEGDRSGLLRQLEVGVPHNRPTFLSYRWIENGDSANKTLLVFGPNLTGQALTLNNEFRWKYVATELRKIVEEQYPGIVG